MLCDLDAPSSTSGRLSATGNILAGGAEACHDHIPATAALFGDFITGVTHIEQACKSAKHVSSFKCKPRYESRVPHILGVTELFLMNLNVYVLFLSLLAFSPYILRRRSVPIISPVYDSPRVFTSRFATLMSPQ
jgi:hypothetical protein